MKKNLKVEINAKSMPFKEQVKLVRMQLQLSQDSFAKQIGVSFATISRWERENRNPQVAHLGKFYSFCQANGIEVNLTK